MGILGVCVMCEGKWVCEGRGRERNCDVDVVCGCVGCGREF